MQTILDLVPVATDMPAETAQDDDGNDVEVSIFLALSMRTLIR